MISLNLVTLLNDDHQSAHRCVLQAGTICHVQIVESCNARTGDHYRRASSTATRPKRNTHDTSRKVIILRVGGGPVTQRVPPVTKTVTSINSISGKIITVCQKG